MSGQATFSSPKRNCRDRKARRQTRRCRFEALEQRQLLAASIRLYSSTGTLGIVADAAGSNVTAYNTVAHGTPVLAVAVSGPSELARLYTRPRALVSRIQFVGSDCNDTFANQANLPSTADGKGGNDVLEGGSAVDRLVGGLGDDTVRGGRGGDTLYGDYKEYAGLNLPYDDSILPGSRWLREIHIRDWDETSVVENDRLRGTVIHEVVHNWNWDHAAEEHPAGYGYWSKFKDLHARSQADDDYADNYGKNNVMEDWATVCQLYFCYLGSESRSDVLCQKLAVRNDFFRGFA